MANTKRPRAGLGLSSAISRDQTVTRTVKTGSRPKAASAKVKPPLTKRSGAGK